MTTARRLAATSDVAVTYQLADCETFSRKPDPYDGVAAIFVQFVDPASRSRMFARIVEEYGTDGPSNVEHLYTAPMLRDAFARLTILPFEGVRKRGYGGLRSLWPVGQDRLGRPALSVAVSSERAVELTGIILVILQFALLMVLGWQVVTNATGSTRFIL